jgi:hypothetical protein
MRCAQVQYPDSDSNQRNAQAFSYALTLEYLQAEFYTCSATGAGIADDLRGGGPPSQGCQKANIQDPTLQVSSTTGDRDATALLTSQGQGPGPG